MLIKVQIEFKKRGNEKNKKIENYIILTDNRVLNHIIKLKQIIDTIIDYMDSSQSNPQTKNLSRDYKCPCGKTYLSNAAIFTHIKQKHGGVAPGPIQKPKLQSKPRGRPPLSSKNKNMGADKNAEKNKELLKEQQVQGSNAYYQAFQQIFNILSQIHERQEINQQIWQIVDTFRRMEEFIQSKQKPVNFRYMGTCIGIGLSEFLKEVSQGLTRHPWRFEQILILFILLLQYAIDESNQPSLIQEAPIQCLIDFMNPFIQQHIQDYAAYLGIQSLWVIKQVNITKIFLCFYNWLKWKDYTQYCITLI